MSSPECAAPSNPGVTDGYTFTADLAREWLGLTQEEMAILVLRSRLNRARGLVGPLELVNGGQSFTLRSVLAYHRSRTAATTL